MIVFSITPAIQNPIRFILMFAAPLLGIAVYLVWQLFASRLPWRDRLLLLGALLLAAGTGFLIADPSMSTALFKVEVLDDKTWNHPIVAVGRLLVRNGVEMVALALAAGAS